MIATQAGIDLESIDRQEEGVTYRIEYDRSAIAPSTAVVASLSTVTDVDPVEMPPLHRSVDPDALDALLGARHEGEGEVPSITFTTGSGHEVTIGDHGVIGIEPPGNAHIGGPVQREQME